MNEPTANSQPISTPDKWLFLLSAWGAAALLSLVINPSSLLAAPFFPIGLVAVWPNGVDKAITPSMTQLLLGWGLYLALHSIILRARKADTFYVFYVALCLLLLLNVGGCQRVLDSAAGIH
jgi:hypothetical protein